MTDGEFDPELFAAERGGWALLGLAIGFTVWPVVAAAIALVAWWRGW